MLEVNSAGPASGRRLRTWSRPFYDGQACRSRAADQTTSASDITWSCALRDHEFIYIVNVFNIPVLLGVPGVITLPVENMQCVTWTGASMKTALQNNRGAVPDRILS